MPSVGKGYRDETRPVDWDALFHDREEPDRYDNEFVAERKQGERKRSVNGDGAAIGSVKFSV